MAALPSGPVLAVAPVQEPELSSSENRKSLDQLWHKLRELRGDKFFEHLEQNGYTSAHDNISSLLLSLLSSLHPIVDAALQPPVSPAYFANVCWRVAQKLFTNMLKDRQNAEMLVDAVLSATPAPHVQTAQCAAALCFVAMHLEHSRDAVYWLARAEHFLGFHHSAQRHYDEVQFEEGYDDFDDWRKSKA